MSQINLLQNEITIARRELKNLRQEILKMKSHFKSQFDAISMLMPRKDNDKKTTEIYENQFNAGQDEVHFLMKPIGLISSCFKNKNGIPRQSSLCQEARAILEINKSHFTNPEHSLISLEEFSYIWILFYFHKNGPQNSIKAKVHPPRLNGASAGVFSTRSPHRPCAIGLSLVKLEKISGNKLYLSGVDMLDETPVLDIKPYIESYDTPPTIENELKNYLQSSSNFQDITAHKYSEKESPESTRTSTYGNKLCQNCSEDNISQKNYSSSKDCSSGEKMKTTEDIQSIPHKNIVSLLNQPPLNLNVIFTTRAECDIGNFHSFQDTCRCNYCLDFIDDVSKAKAAIIEVLKNDPRSVYRRNKCPDRLYFFEIDKMHVTCWFEENDAEILRVKPVNKC